jgi:hypothetical protein
MFEWKHYLELTRFLQQEAGKTDNPEPFLRAALSRAYYGASCYARNYARDWLQFQASYVGDDHGRLRDHLRKRRRRGTSDKLQRLREWRNECDYHDDLSFDARVILDTAVIDATYVFNSLAPPSPPASA